MSFVQRKVDHCDDCGRMEEALRLLRQVRYAWPVMNLIATIPNAKDWAGEVDTLLARAALNGERAK